MRTSTYYVYIPSNPSNSVLYIGVTNNLFRRVHEHKQKLIAGFTTKYNVTKLVYFEEFLDSNTAIAREKQLKAGSRAKKLALIVKQNPLCIDLYEQLL